MNSQSPWNIEKGKSKKAMSIADLSQELGIPAEEIIIALKKIEHTKPERIQVPHVSPSGKRSTKFVLTYSAEDVEKIRRHFYSDIQEKEDQNVETTYVTKYTLRKDLGISEGVFEYFLQKTLQSLSEEISKEDSQLVRNASDFQTEIKKSKGVEYFSPTIHQKMKELLTQEKVLREHEAGQYFTLTQIIRMLKLENDTTARKRIKTEITKLLEQEPTLETGAVERAPSIGSSPVVHYSKKIFESVQKKVDRERQDKDATREKQIPPDYISRLELSDLLGIELSKTTNFLKEFLTSHTNLVKPLVRVFKKTKNRSSYTNYYSPEVVEKIKIYIGQLQERKATKKAERMEKNREHAAFMKEHGRNILQERQHKNQLLRESQKRQLEQEYKEVAESKKKITNFFVEVEQGSTLRGSDFKKLILIFGSANLIDLLFQFEPECKRLPLSYIKNEVAKYLGDLLLVRATDYMENLEIALPFLGKETYQESLFHRMKEDGITYYSKTKKKNKEQEDVSIINEFVNTLREKLVTFDNPDLNVVFIKVEAYFDALLHSSTKPSSVVHQLVPGRQFPDLNQLINVKEIKDQKRILIADEMGMGKSASAILAKEYLNVGPTLLVAPNNVIDTWKKYLSDEVDKDGKQLGYFKKGCAPRIIEITAPEELGKVDIHDFDYVLISQERLKDDYTETLREVGFEMFIVDEVHKFKNISEGKRSQALITFLTGLEKNDTYTVLLSGTPVPNKIKDIAIILKLLYPEEYRDMSNKELVRSIVRGDLIDLRSLLFKKMQMKKLIENIEMPDKTESASEVSLSKNEADVYELLLGDDDLLSSEKLHILRQFCLNPESLLVDRKMVGSKITKASEDLQEIFKSKKRVIFFVNGYIDGVIRGENTIQEQMGLPKDIQVLIIDGNVEREKRKEIESELRHNKNGKILLIVSGQTADVGVDFSEAEAMYFYNEPWTRYDKMQQTARTYRPGLKQDLEVKTSITQGTIEEGIHEHIQIKFNAVQKLLQGIPLSELEKAVVTLDEKAESESSFDTKSDLAEEWLQSPIHVLNKFFKTTKEIGVEKFATFLQKHGEEYAKNYSEYSSGGHQANTARLIAALIAQYKKEKGFATDEDMTILDLGSGPEMLAQHIQEEDRGNIVSLDMNQHHFTQGQSAHVVGDITSLPIRSSSADYINLSSVFHYLQAPGDDNSERLSTILEIARVLKVGGRCSISMAPSLEFKNEKILWELLDMCGLEVVKAISGTFTYKQAFRSECLTFEKKKEIDPAVTKEEIQNHKYFQDGLNIRKTAKANLKNDELIANTFTLHGEKIQAELNSLDNILLTEQEEIEDEGRLLKQQYGSIQLIPRLQILSKGFIRYHNGKRYKLAKKSMRTNTFSEFNK